MVFTNQVYMNINIYMRMYNTYRSLKIVPPVTCAFFVHSRYDSHYLPCPTGAHYETSRIWEALEAGTIPIIVGGNEHEMIAVLFCNQFKLRLYTVWGIGGCVCVCMCVCVCACVCVCV